MFSLESVECLAAVVSCLSASRLYLPGDCICDLYLSNFIVMLVDFINAIIYKKCM